MDSAVLVTGASTGIGRACALRLAKAGHRVFAGVRKDADGVRLVSDGGSGIEPILIDVADERSIGAAHDKVRAGLGEHRLAGLVNNAGIAVAGPQETLALADWKRQFDVNVFGAVETTRTFFGLLQEARGRVVNISSVGGRIATPFMAPYSASKFALEAVTAGLRLEIRPLGMWAACIEPGAVKTEIWKKGTQQIDDLKDNLPAPVRDKYKSAITGMEKFTSSANERGVSADRVAKAVEHALFARWPRTRYPVGPDARILIALRWLLPDALFDRLLALAV